MWADIHPATAFSKNLQIGFLAVGYWNQRELHTLAEVLDRLAAGETGRAADLFAQRFKAVKLSLHDGDWSRATTWSCPRPAGGS